MRRLLVPALPLGLVALLLSAPAPRASAAPPPDERALVDDVNRSIAAGVQFLRVSMRAGKDWEGFWQYQMVDLDGGVTALATLALLNCGEKPDTPEVKAALDTLRAQPRKATYVVALMTMAFAEARQARDLPLIQGNVDWLLTNARRKNGRITGWSYWSPGSGNSGFDVPDSSNTQYALLGLYAGKQAGAKIAEAEWEQLFDLYLKSQKPDRDPSSGWWGYRPDDPRPSFTMTTAGVSGLVISGLGLARSQQGLDPNTGVAANCGKYAEALALERGLNYIGKNFTFTRPFNGPSTFYNTYGIERVGRLSGQRFLGTIDWYREGCEFLVKGQKKNGSWTQSLEESGVNYDGVSVISTSFSLLFLSKGRTPILVSKLAWGAVDTDGRGAFAERVGDGHVVGWNRKHNDVRHLTEFASRDLFKGAPMGWQIYDPRRRELATDADILAEVGGLVQSPILYLNGHEAPRLNGQQKKILKKYVEEGGFVVAEACCGSPEFAAGFRALANELFEGTPLKPVPPEHALWQSFYAVPPTSFPKLECLDRGCRTVMVFSPEPLAGFWEEAKYIPPPGKGDTNRAGQAYRLGANVIAYATGLEPPGQRGGVRRIAAPGKADQNPPNGFLKPAQLKLLDETPPAPNAMRNLMGHARTAAKLDVVLDPVLMSASDPDLFKFKFLYLHGRKRFTLSAEEQENLRVALQSGGLLLADAACGKPEFDAAFRTEVAKLFPDSKLVPIPLDDELYSEKILRPALTTVKRREKASGTGADAGFADLPPALEGVKIDGRWALIYSKYDLGCSLEGHRSSDCLGHTRESALRISTAAVVYMLKK